MFLFFMVKFLKFGWKVRLKFSDNGFVFFLNSSNFKISSFKAIVFDLSSIFLSCNLEPFSNNFCTSFSFLTRHSKIIHFTQIIFLNLEISPFIKTPFQKLPSSKIVYHIVLSYLFLLLLFFHHTVSLEHVV